MTPDPAPVSPDQTARPRAWVPWFIGLFLVFQLLLPLRFYLNRPTPDERFAWRMFSFQGMQDCRAAVWEDVEADGAVKPRRLDLREAVLSNWMGQLENIRPSVVDKFMRWRCEQPGVLQVRVNIHCTNVDGTSAGTTTFWMDSDERIVHAGEPGS